MTVRTTAASAAGAAGAADGGFPEDWTLVHTSARLARERGGHPAVVCDGRVTDYATLHRQSNRVAHALAAAGVGPGSRVAYLGRESEYYYLSILACAKAGAVLVPVNWRLTAGEVTHILGDSGASVLLLEQEFAGAVDGISAGIGAASGEGTGARPGPRTVVPLDGPGPDGERRVGAGLLAWAADQPDTEPAAVPRPDDPVVQIYTSGTTGLPKGVVLAHRSFFTLPHASRAEGVDWLDWRPDDVSLISLPGFGIAGIAWFLHSLNAGATTVVMPMYVPQEAVRLIAERKVTITFAAPAMLQMMLGEREAGPEAFRSLRKIAYGAAPISPGLLARSMEVYGCEFAQIYASTETGSVAVCLPPADHRPGSEVLTSAGLPCPGVELKVVGPDGDPLPPGEIGQVCIRTPSRMLGYWNLPEATAKTLVDGWLMMGDAGYLDKDGYLFLCDRINDTVIVAGQNIYPAEVEKELAEHPAVADAAVVGLPDERWGEAVHAAVLPHPGSKVSPRALLLFLRGRLAGYKIPVAFHIVAELPRNPAGKILRRTVREQLARETGARPPEPAAPPPTRTEGGS
ncbi:long-chain-fatty-acid--CoA ligase [Streptomyces jumonjinensis]|uniref:long-chain-fatty-acid--CoA ligase n=1 Tax=Streptomyces jumonjinensis TaxID=1945 RepID=UPI0037944A00